MSNSSEMTCLVRAAVIYSRKRAPEKTAPIKAEPPTHFVNDYLLINWPVVPSPHWLSDADGYIISRGVYVRVFSRKLVVCGGGVRVTGLFKIN